MYGWLIALEIATSHINGDWPCGSGCPTCAIEAAANRWKPGEEDRVTPPTEIWMKQSPIVGSWGWSDGFSAGSITVEPTAGGRYRVSYWEAGCTYRLEQVRTAKFQNGILQLNRPVGSSPDFDRLYPILVGNAVRLVNPRNIASLAINVAFEKGNRIQCLTYTNSKTVDPYSNPGIIEIEISNFRKQKPTPRARVFGTTCH